MKKKIFFGFLYIDKKIGKLNFQSKNFEERYSVYLKNAAQLNLSIRKCGYKFIILTNNKAYIQKKIKKDIKNSICVQEILFKTSVPRNMHFFSCHYRVDVFRYFSKLRNTISILLDLDVVIIRNLKKINFSIFSNTGIVHDISSNFFPAYGIKKVSSDLEMLTGFKINNAKWYGGDFIAGSENFFHILHTKTKKYQEKFIKLSKKFSNYTDEFFLTAAILDIEKNKNYKIVDGSKLKIWSRYWSVNTKHKQNKIENYLKFFMLHLPADKNFIANFYESFGSAKYFKKVYVSKINAYSHRLLNKFKKIVKIFYQNLF
jgi:hypothetical protein